MTFETAETVDLPSFERWLNNRGNGGSAFACAEAKFWLDQRQADVRGNVRVLSELNIAGLRAWQLHRSSPKISIRLG